MPKSCDGHTNSEGFRCPLVELVCPSQDLDNTLIDNYDNDMDFNDITEDDIVGYLLSNLFLDLNNINLEWAEKVPPNILVLVQNLMKELEKC